MSKPLVFLCPGLTGTQLRECTTGKLLWLSPELLMNCPASLMKHMDVTYDKDKKVFISHHGVVPGGDIGDLKSIKTVSEPSLCVTGQFEQLCRYLVHIGGYKEEKDLFGLPYDWRLILDDKYWAHYAEDLKKFIEMKVESICDHPKIIIIGFSLGCLVTARFLRMQTPDWRKKHIDKVILGAPPLGGCPKAFMSVCRTVDEMPGIQSQCVRMFLQRCSGAFMCHPSPHCFKKMNILKGIKLSKYSRPVDFRVEEIREAYHYQAFGTESARDIYEHFGEFINNQTEQGIADDVECHVIYSSVKDTTVGLDYCGNMDCKPRPIKESEYHSERFGVEKADCMPCGDGIVPYISLSYWNDKSYPSGKPYVTTFRCFKGRQFEHADLFGRVPVIQHVYNLLQISCLEKELQ